MPSAKHLAINALITVVVIAIVFRVTALKDAVTGSKTVTA